MHKIEKDDQAYATMRLSKDLIKRGTLNIEPESQSSSVGKSVNQDIMQAFKPKLKLPNTKIPDLSRFVSTDKDNSPEVKLINSRDRFPKLALSNEKTPFKQYNERLDRYSPMRAAVNVVGVKNMSNQFDPRNSITNSSGHDSGRAFPERKRSLMKVPNASEAIFASKVEELNQMLQLSLPIEIGKNNIKTGNNRSKVFKPLKTLKSKHGVTLKASTQMNGTIT